MVAISGYVPEPKRSRKIVQVASTEYRHYLWVVALCDDGSLWQLRVGDEDWHRLPSIPQPETPDARTQT